MTLRQFAILQRTASVALVVDTSLPSHQFIGAAVEHDNSDGLNRRSEHDCYVLVADHHHQADNHQQVGSNPRISETSQCHPADSAAVVACMNGSEIFNTASALSRRRLTTFIMQMERLHQTQDTRLA